MAEATAETRFQIIQSEGTPTLNGGGGAQVHSRRSETAIGLKASVMVEASVIRSSRILDWDDLYSAEFGRSALVVRARQLLARGEESLSKALNYLKDDDPVSADYEITLFQGAIPELFCCNSIGEGFSAVVVALRWALKNRRGDPLTFEQLYAALNCVVRLNKQLFMKYEAALDLIDDLEKVGLNTDISIAAPLVRLLIEETGEPSAK